jgi:hypothetical protein
MSVLYIFRISNTFYLLTNKPDPPPEFPFLRIVHVQVFYFYQLQRPRERRVAVQNICDDLYTGVVVPLPSLLQDVIM